MGTIEIDIPGFFGSLSVKPGNNYTVIPFLHEGSAQAVATKLETNAVGLPDGRWIGLYEDLIQSWCFSIDEPEPLSGLIAECQ